MTTAVAPREPEKGTVAKRDVRFLEAFGDKVLEKLPAEKQAAFLIALGEHIGLRAELGELILYQGKPYPTREGRLRMAHRSGLFNGLEVRPASDRERRNYGCDENDVVWVASAWRIGATRPFVGWGRVGKGDRNPVSKTHPAEMAKKRATYDALRLAFPLKEELTDLHQRYIEEAEQLAAETRRTAHPVLAAAYDPEDGPETGDDPQAEEVAAEGQVHTTVIEDPDAATEDQIARILELADHPALAAGRDGILAKLEKPGLKRKVAASWIVALEAGIHGPGGAPEAPELAIGDTRGKNAVREGH